MHTQYTLVILPESQKYMSEEWFKKETYLMQGHNGQVHFDSCYFIPSKRIKEFNKKLKILKLSNL